MAHKKQENLQGSLDSLSEAIKFYGKEKTHRDVAFLALAKAFEVAVEYTWKGLKRRVDDEGVDAPSPKETIRQAARLGFIDSAEDWLGFIDTRNNSVHDYFGMGESEYVDIIKQFYKKAQKLTLD